MDDFRTQLILDNVGAMAFSLVAPQIGVGALVFLRNLDASLALSNSLMSVGPASSSNNDMHRLGKFAEDNVDSVTVFPSAPSPSSKLFRSEISADFRCKVSKNSEFLGGIFDGATIGQYLFGLDPRNSRGFKTLGFSPPDHAIDAEKATYFSTGTSLFLESGNGAHVPVLSLHIHSKDLRMFKAKTRESLIKKRVYEQHRGQRNELDPRAFAHFIQFATRHAVRRAGQAVSR
jgi:hypothetical protein